MPRARIMAACLTLLLTGPGVAQANTLPREVEHSIPAAQLNGQGSYRWFGLKLYDAYLWCETRPARAAQVWRTPFVLELVYARNLSGQRIAEASIGEMRKLERGTPGQQAEWLRWMSEIFPDVQEGTRLSGVFLPGKGIRFYRDGELLKEIADAEFAQAFFAIWLDEQSGAAGLRRALLGAAR